MPAVHPGVPRTPGPQLCPQPSSSQASWAVGKESWTPLVACCRVSADPSAPEAPRRKQGYVADSKRSHLGIPGLDKPHHLHLPSIPEGGTALSLPWPLQQGPVCLPASPQARTPGSHEVQRGLAGVHASQAALLLPELSAPHKALLYTKTWSGSSLALGHVFQDNGTSGGTQGSKRGGPSCMQGGGPSPF